jgi:hypothetical protein
MRVSDHPVLVAVGTLAAVATILTFACTFVLDCGVGGERSENGPSRPCADPQLSLSTGSGPSGTSVTVAGSGFPSARSVELRFHTEQLAPARTDEAGDFRVDVRIPGTFDPFAPQQFEITAVTLGCHDSVPFQLQR